MSGALAWCMFRDGSITLFRVRGVPVKAHWTLLLIIPYLTVALSYQFVSVAILAGVAANQLVLPPIAWGALLASALFASVAVHELAHTLVAMRYGGRVQSITLMLLGGASVLSRAPPRPLHELLMAAAGPATSFAIGFACAAAYALLDLPPDAQMSLFYLAGMNISLALFNLLPAFPMDGGRMLRALLAARVGRSRATEIAASIGKLCAIVLGVFAVAHVQLMLGLIAMYVYAGATGAAIDEQIAGILAPLGVTDLLARSRPIPVIDAGIDLATAARHMSEHDQLELVVVDAQGPLAILEARDVTRLIGTRAAWSLASLMPQLRSRFIAVPKAETATTALTAAAEREAPYVVVVDPPGTVIGLIGPHDVDRTARLQTLRDATLAA